MLSDLRASSLGIFLTFAVGCSFGAGDRAAIVALLRAQETAWNRGDLEGFLRAYEPSDALVFTAGGAVQRGFAATRSRYLARYKGAQEAMGRLALEVLDVRALGRSGAVVLGRWRLTATPNAGGGVFTLALVRDGAGWKIVHDHTSADAPRP